MSVKLLHISAGIASIAKLPGSNEGSYGGSIYNEGQIIVFNSTLAYNMAIGSSSYGGGIYSSVSGASSSTTVNFCTIYGNSSYVGGGVWLGPGSHLLLSSSIVANKSSAGFPDIFLENAGVLTSGGYNLIQNTAGVDGLDSTDQQVTLSDLKLDSTLSNHGGLTPTLALLPGSLAIDAIPAEICSSFTDISGHAITITTDQRGDSRPDGGEQKCDIGAYESSY